VCFMCFTCFMCVSCVFHVCFMCVSCMLVCVSACVGVCWCVLVCLVFIVTFCCVLQVPQRTTTVAILSPSFSLNRISPHIVQFIGLFCEFSGMVSKFLNDCFRHLFLRVSANSIKYISYVSNKFL